MASRVGFVGLGNIGRPMARNLLHAGFALTVFDLDPEPGRQLAAEGARVAASLAELGPECDPIGVCVRDDAEVEEVLFGLLGAACPGTIVAIHSTIRPRTVVRLAETAAARGVHVLDVPVTGGAHGAEARTLCCMAGGDAQLVERCRAVFETSASTIVPTGPLGSGMKTKLCTNLMTYLGFVAAFEAMRLAEAAGLPRETVQAVTQANGVLTRSMLAYLDMQEDVRGRGADEAARQQLARFADLAEKDLAITLEVADELSVPLPAAALCRMLMARVYGLE